MPKIKNQLQLDGMEEEEVIKLSPTSLNLYLECPRCFWLHFNKKIRRPSGPFPSLPGGMDQVLKIYFDEYRGTEILPPIVAEKLQGKLMDPLPKSLMLTDKSVRAILTGKLDEALDLGGGKSAADTWAADLLLVPSRGFYDLPLQTCPHPNPTLRLAYRSKSLAHPYRLASNSWARDP